MSRYSSIECDYWWERRHAPRSRWFDQSDCEREMDGDNLIAAKRWARQEGWVLDFVIPQFSDPTRTRKIDLCPIHAKFAEDMKLEPRKRRDSNGGTA